jgi:hypothetical protein
MFIVTLRPFWKGLLHVRRLASFARDGRSWAVVSAREQVQAFVIIQPFLNGHCD